MDAYFVKFDGQEYKIDADFCTNREGTLTFYRGDRPSIVSCEFRQWDLWYKMENQEGDESAESAE